jgi:phosphoserine phosphatase
MGSVVFDCDSTLSAIEGIEYIAADHREAVEALTRGAMDGTVPLEAVYGRRLELVKPDRAAIEGLTTAYIDALVPDAREVVTALRAEGVAVRVISGGLLPAVRGLAAALGLNEGDVAAVDVRFDPDGRWAGWETGSPLARSGGKSEILSAWLGELPTPVMMVGDGATDAETRDVVDVFVAYCGVVERPAVVARADFVIRDASLAPVLALALDAPPSDADHHALYEKGRSLLTAGAVDAEQPEPGNQRV